MLNKIKRIRRKLDLKVRVTVSNVLIKMMDKEMEILESRALWHEYHEIESRRNGLIDATERLVKIDALQDKVEAFVA